MVKVLINDSRTQSELDNASPNTLILSHFIWTGGQYLDRSIKGLLCCLLYQLLQEDRVLSSSAIQKFPWVSKKHFVGDWSNEELDEILFSLFQSASRPICLFIDGLDELDPSDGYFRLLELINRFTTVPWMKICVSSRPEPVLQDHFKKFPWLRMQDLTWSAMWAHATDFLTPYFKSNETNY